MRNYKIIPPSLETIIRFDFARDHDNKSWLWLVLELDLWAKLFGETRKKFKAWNLPFAIVI